MMSLDLARPRACLLKSLNENGKNPYYCNLTRFSKSVIYQTLSSTAAVVYKGQPSLFRFVSDHLPYKLINDSTEAFSFLVEIVQNFFFLNSRTMVGCRLKVDDKALILSSWDFMLGRGKKVRGGFKYK